MPVRYPSDAVKVNGPTGLAAVVVMVAVAVVGVMGLLEVVVEGSMLGRAGDDRGLKTAASG
jgi:hypothetical protein